ncbi:hypothetical protein BT69DRAFT_1009900 [Atractiella rhizophila]|nr:hypothetical protein BT69DRAFT_1009900 [Atractiella rhizophila]
MAESNSLSSRAPPPPPSLQNDQAPIYGLTAQPNFYSELLEAPALFGMGNEKAGHLWATPWGQHGWLPPGAAPRDDGFNRVDVERQEEEMFEMALRLSREEERVRRAKLAKERREREIREAEEEARKERLSHPSLSRKTDASRPAIPPKIPSPQTSSRPLRPPLVSTSSRHTLTSPPPLQSPKVPALKPPPISTTPVNSPPDKQRDMRESPTPSLPPTEL